MAAPGPEERAEIIARILAPREVLCPRCGQSVGVPADFADRWARLEAHRIETGSHGAGDGT